MTSVADDPQAPPGAAGEELLKLWQGRVTLARYYQQEVGDTEKRWETFRRALASDFSGAGRLASHDTERVDVNMVHGTTVTNLAPLYTSPFHLTVTPTSERIEIGGRSIDNVARARFTELELNYWLRELEFQHRVLRRCVHDAEITNHMYSYVGFIREGQRHLVERDGRRVEPNPLIQVNRPFIRRLSPRQVLVPWGCEQLDEAPWIVIGWHWSVGACKRAWPDTTEDLGPTVYYVNDQARDKMPPEIQQFAAAEDSGQVQIWQAWDRVEGTVVTLAEGHQEVLEEAEWPFEFEGFPVVEERFVDVPDEYYGTPPIQMYWPQQMELNKARTTASQRNNRTKATVFVRADIADELIKLYADSDDGEIIKVPISQEVDIRSVLYVFEGLKAPHEAYADGAVQINDILFTTGLGAQQRSQGDPNIDSATASALVDKWALVRATDRGSRTSNFIVGTFRKLWKVLQQVDGVEVERVDTAIKGRLGRMVTSQRYSLTDLRGEFGISMDVGSLLAQNPVLREQRAVARYNLLRPDSEVEPQRLILDMLDSQQVVDPQAWLSDMRDPEEELALMARALPVEPNLREDLLGHKAAHEQQINRLMAVLDAPNMDPASEDGQRVRLVLALVTAHLNATGMMIEQLSGKPQRGPGQPVNENAARGMAARETSAELGGQPLDGSPGAAAGLTGIAQTVG